MPASCNRTAIYRVTWEWPAQEKDGAFLDLSNSVHPDSPKLTMPEPWVGPLCEHEVSVLNGESNSATLSSQWTFDLDKLFDGAKPKDTKAEREKVKRDILDELEAARAIATPIDAALLHLRSAREKMARHNITDADLLG